MKSDATEQQPSKPQKKSVDWFEFVVMTFLVFGGGFFFSSIIGGGVSSMFDFSPYIFYPIMSIGGIITFLIYYFCVVDTFRNTSTLETLRAKANKTIKFFGKAIASIFILAYFYILLFGFRSCSEVLPDIDSEHYEHRTDKY